MDQATGLASLRLERINKLEFWLGVGLVAMSFLMPVAFTVVNFNIFGTLFQALDQNEKTALMLAALKLVCLNSLRALPHYVGAFFLAESLEFRRGNRNSWIINALVVILVLQLAYWGIEAVHGIYYDFGIPAILVMAILILFDKLNYQYIAVPKKILLLSSVLVAFQFLDVMPAFHNLPMGRGEVSLDVKMASSIMGADMVLNALSIAGCTLFSMFSLLVFLLLRDENNLLQMATLREQNQTMRTDALINEMENRTHQEMRALVHDLKSPLTTVQTLVGVIKMECEMERRQNYIEYLNHIETAVEQMSRMISELLYEGNSTPETVQWLVDRALSQISVEPYAACLETDVRSPQALVRVNQVLFPRALVNLIQNSAKAISPGQQARISLCVEAKGGLVRFQVKDNGCGIPKERQQDIWTMGYSGTHSSGLGLTFVRDVIERMGGTIELDSTVGQGTSITLCLPEEEESEHEP